MFITAFTKAIKNLRAITKNLTIIYSMSLMIQWQWCPGYLMMNFTGDIDHNRRRLMMKSNKDNDPVWHLKKMRNEFLSAIKANHDKLFSSLYANQLDDVGAAMSNIVKECLFFAERTESARIRVMALLAEVKKEQTN